MADDPEVVGGGEAGAEEGDAAFDRAFNEALDQIETLAEEQEREVQGQPRDEFGRFQAREQSQEAQQAQPTGPQWPEHWSEQRRALIASLPEEHRAAVYNEWLGIEHHLHEQHRQLAEQRQAIDPVFALLEPYRQQWAAAGVHPAQALQSFLGAMQALRTNPAEALVGLAEQVGRPLAGSASAQQELLRRLQSALGIAAGAAASPPSAQNEWLDPQAQAFATAAEAQQAQFAAQLSEMQQYIAVQQQHQQAMAERQAYEQAVAFQNERSADQGLRHPFMDQLRPEMARLVNAGYDLETAYQTALMSRPEVRAVIMNQISSGAEGARRATVARARAASVRPNGRSRPNAVMADEMSLDEALEAAVDRVMAENAM